MAQTRDQRDTIRTGEPADLAAVEALVRAAYAGYVARLGKPPGPMLDDYAARIAAGTLSVLESEGEICGLIVLLPQADHIMVDNVAVAPRHQGRGLARRLLGFAEAEAGRLGLAELRLYTHVSMVENQAIYRHYGWEETGRGEQAGYARVFMRKRLPAPQR